jgi:hypothetical protein
MDTAAWAAQSWPRSNPNFRRTWLPPPLKRKRRSPAGAAPFEIVGNGIASSNTASALAAARAVRVAAARAGRLQHQARILRGIGQLDAALRLAALAEAIRVEVLA